MTMTMIMILIMIMTLSTCQSGTHKQNYLKQYTESTIQEIKIMIYKDGSHYIHLGCCLARSSLCTWVLACVILPACIDYVYEISYREIQQGRVV